MLILGIESSCDETAIALVENGKRVVSSIIASQVRIHERWGGVVPEIAAREHLAALSQVYSECLQTAGLSSASAVDAIAVTQGPGLVGSLLVGVSFAKGLAQSLCKPLVPVNHVHAHIHGALLGIDRNIDELFPCLALVASGGHTNLYFMKNPTHFSLLAHTMDDAVGESFDKVGKMLQLPYPGGPEIEKIASDGDPSRVVMPRMLERREQLGFSYSGLKTAVSLAVRAHADDSGTISDARTRASIAAAFQAAAVEQIVRKTKDSLAYCEYNPRSIIISGGVAANKLLQKQMRESFHQDIFFPDLRFCSDNGAMIAALGYYQWKAEDVLVSRDWDVFSRYPFEVFLSQKLSNHRTGARC